MKSRFMAIFAILSIVSCLFASCGAAADKDAPKTTEGEPNSTSEPLGEYVFPNLDCGGIDFTILNAINEWAFYSDIAFENMTGEALDDAIYKRNRMIEEKFNVNIKEAPAQVVGALGQKLRNAVLSGEDIYDAAFCPSVETGALLAEGMLHNLNKAPGLNLGENWWNQSVMASAAIGSSKSVYFAFSDMDIFTLQCAWCIFINEKMITDLGLARPYELVKGGKWTYDKFYEYMMAGAQLNGADSFKWQSDGPAVYGYTSFSSGTRALLTGSGENMVAADAKGMPYLTLKNERFYNVCDKLGAMLNTKASGGYEDANDYHTPYHFEAMFENSRAFMMGGELKAANSIRGMETAFGILPMPKYDEIQGRYCTAITVWAPVMVVPATNGNLERTGAIMDALAYVSAKDVTPIFFDVCVSQKQLRNDESIEMLQIIRDTLLFDIGYAYGWTNSMADLIVETLNRGRSSNIASIIEKQIDKAQANIDKMMGLIEN